MLNVGIYSLYLGHMAWRPPSTGRLTPVIKLAASDARKAMLCATSSTSPGRPSAWVCLHFARNCRRKVTRIRITCIEIILDVCASQERKRITTFLHITVKSTTFIYTWCNRCKSAEPEHTAPRPAQLSCGHLWWSRQDWRDKNQKYA